MGLFRRLWRRTEADTWEYPVGPGSAPPADAPVRAAPSGTLIWIDERGNTHIIPGPRKVLVRDMADVVVEFSLVETRCCEIGSHSDWIRSVDGTWIEDDKEPRGARQVGR